MLFCGESTVIVPASDKITHRRQLALLVESCKVNVPVLPKSVALPKLLVPPMRLKVMLVGDPAVAESVSVSVPTNGPWTRRRVSPLVVKL